ncbi:MAG: DUF2851 family protein, partial [Bacteroidales bacterium]|nr:DUF2851 family protein [Bacteroidales bacterium]
MKSTFKNIPEDFFHYLWKHRMLSPGLQTINGEKLSIIHPGIHNHDSGPDFQYARIRIGNTLWAGNVEIHILASDWYRHQHNTDEAYNNVILHVVVENDRIVKDSTGRKLQTICIKGAFEDKLLQRYKEISHNLLWVPCQNLLSTVAPIHVTGRINALAVQRLFDKTGLIRHELAHLKMDWEECCFRLLSRQFGAKINTASFEMLAKTLSVKILMKYHGDLFQLEALLFGQSGLLNRSLYGKFPRRLKKEHAYLAAKHRLSPMPGYLWKFMRLRPIAFPSLRISQLAALYHKNQSVFQEIIEMETINSLYSFFDLTASEYWDTHYILDRKSKRCQKKFGRQSIQLLLINAIIPLIHLYGQEMNKPALCDRALTFMEILPPENNAIIRKWNSIGVRAENSLESQGLLQLKNTACDNKL